MRDAKIRKLDEKTTRPDAGYTTNYLEAGGQSYEVGRGLTAAEIATALSVSERKIFR